MSSNFFINRLRVLKTAVAKKWWNETKEVVRDKYSVPYTETHLLTRLFLQVDLICWL